MQYCPKKNQNGGNCANLDDAGATSTESSKTIQHDIDDKTRSVEEVRNNLNHYAVLSYFGVTSVYWLDLVDVDDD